MATAQLSALRAAASPVPAEAALPTVRAGFFDLQAFELIQRVSKALASSDLVPKTYQGNLANCMIAMDMAQRIGANPLMVMQNLYIVHGTPSWSSKFLVATINACGRFSSLRYEWKGEPGSPEYGCRAWALEKATGERLDGIWVTWKMVRAEGWDSKNGSKWKTIPDQMFLYRAAAFWQRAYAPELGMGLITAEEAADVVDVRSDGTFTVTTETLRTDMRRADWVAAAPESIDGSTGEIIPATQPAFDAAAFIARIEACADLATLQVLNDETEHIPEGPELDAVLAALEKRDAELSAAGAVGGAAAHAAPQAPAQAPAPAPTARRARPAGLSAD